MKMTIIGHGYVGLVTAAVFAKFGHEVWVIGRSDQKIENLKEGIIPFYEPGLKRLVKEGLKNNHLNFTLGYQQALENSKLAVICVGTPANKDNSADLQEVFKATENIARSLPKSFIAIATKSTVPPGTNYQIAEKIAQVSQSDNFAVASLPEFLSEGTAITNTLKPDRIIVGVENERAKKILLEAHQDFKTKIFICNIASAELIKYAANAFLATKISFANSIAHLSEKIGADALRVMAGVGLDKRIGTSFFLPGIGFGGSCFPKDIKALMRIAQDLDYNFTLLESVAKINEQTRLWFVQKMILKLGSLNNKKIALLGLSYKPDTDDLREAPAVYIGQLLLDKGALLRVFDPKANAKASQILKNVVYCKNPYETVENVEALLILTQWRQFRNLDFSKIKKLMARPLIFDGRNFLDKTALTNLGFEYQGVGIL